MEKGKLELDQNTRLNYENTYRKQYFQQIQQLSIEFKALIELSARMVEQVETAKQLVNALKEQLESGNIQMTEYINAVKNYKTISRNINMVNVQKLQVINEMNFLLTQ